MPKKQIAGVIVFDSRANVLVLEKTNGEYDLPKGHPEPGESLLQTALRECYEETNLVFPSSGFEVYPDIYIDVFSRSFVRFYLATAMFDFILLSNEHEVYYWLDQDSAIEAFESDGNFQFAKAIQRMYRKLEQNFELT